MLGSNPVSFDMWVTAAVLDGEGRIPVESEEWIKINVLQAAAAWL